MNWEKKKKKKPKRVKKIFNINALIILILAVQMTFIVFLLLNVWQKSTLIYGVQILLTLPFVCYVVNKQYMNTSYKLVWIILILLIPMVGATLYVILHAQLGTITFKNHKNKMLKLSKPMIPQNEYVVNELKDENIYISHLADYVNNYGYYPIYKNTSVEYFSSGEEKFDALIRELEKAENFIFMEYFIIGLGRMWDTVLEILERKVSQGVEVRLIYDGMGCQFTLPNHYCRYLESLGIKCREFNEFRPFLSTAQNNRDHRKIVVIDGHTAFNGGINIADEYINEKERFGHWKDTAVMLKGEAVWSFTVMFIQMWEWKTKNLSNYEKYRIENVSVEADGYVLPYGDSPTNNQYVGKYVYMDIINKAKDYVYITTPYLIVDSEIVSSLEFAAKSGVDVKIIVPHIQDKWYAGYVGWVYYKEFTRIGIKVYEYMPGFIHAKNFVSDDTTAVVGTINLDFRSLYLHFECATFMYKTQAVGNVKSDFLETLAKCREITLEDWKKRRIWKKILGYILRMIAPLF